MRVDVSTSMNGILDLLRIEKWTGKLTFMMVMDYFNLYSAPMFLGMWLIAPIPEIMFVTASSYLFIQASKR
jgi:hypothetical protein